MTPGEPTNLYDLAVEERDTRAPVGFQSRWASLGEALGAERLGGTIWEVDPGDKVNPYHYEGVEEEWLLVLTGAPILRDPAGEHELVEGDVVCFPVGPEGAHQVINRSDAVVRILMLSTIPLNELSICVYPDSDKVGVWPPGKRLRMGENVDYWDGEG
jgi:uncharacterized cupin superfamily protein